MSIFCWAPKLCLFHLACSLWCLLNEYFSRGLESRGFVSWLNWLGIEMTLARPGLGPAEALLCFLHIPAEPGSEAVIHADWLDTILSLIIGNGRVGLACIESNVQIRSGFVQMFLSYWERPGRGLFPNFYLILYHWLSWRFFDFIVKAVGGVTIEEPSIYFKTILLGHPLDIIPLKL